jgi:hypothetical protein
VGNDDFGTPHKSIGGLPPDDQTIDYVWVLIAVTKAGGEGVYSQTIGKYMYNFVVTDAPTKDQLEDHLREMGSIEVSRREGIKLVWRRLGSVEEEIEIT